MGKSKKDLTRQKGNIVARIAILEEKARLDPLKKIPAIHRELADLKKKLEEV